MNRGSDLDTVALLDRTARNVSTATITLAQSVRNLGWDNTFYPVLQDALLNNKSLLMVVPRAAGELASLLDGAFNPRTGQTGFDEIMGVFGLDMEITSKALYANMSDSVVVSGRKTKGKWNNAAYTGAKVSDKVADVFTGLALNDRINRKARVNATSRLGHILTETFARTWDESSNGFKELFSRYGWGQAEFDLLRKVEPMNMEVDSFVIGKKKIGLGPHPDKIKSLKGAELDSVRRGGESDIEVINRLTSTYKLLFKQWHQNLAATPSVKGEILNFGNPYVKAAVGQYTSFFNITVSQGLNLFKSLYTAIGNSSFEIDKLTFLKGLANPAGGAALVTYAAGAGVGMLWAKDILQGKTPRDLTPGVLFEALSSTGFGSMYTYLLNNYQYNGLKGLFTPPVAATGERVIQSSIDAADLLTLDVKGKKGKKMKQERQARLIHNLRKTVPIFDLWYGEWAGDLLAKRLKIPVRRSERSYDAEIGRENYIDPESPRDKRRRQRRKRKEKRLEGKRGISKTIKELAKKPIIDMSEVIK